MTNWPFWVRCMLLTMALAFPPLSTRHDLGMKKVVSQRQADAMVERFLEKSREQVGIPMDYSEEYFEEHLADGVDEIAGRVEAYATKSAHFRNALALSLKADDVAGEERPDISLSQPRRRSVPSVPSLANLLEDEEADESEGSPIICHRKNQVDFESLKTMVNHEIKRMPLYDRKVLQRVTNELITYEDNGGDASRDVSIVNRSVPFHRQLLRWAETVSNVGIDALDRFYCAPGFFFKIPIIGHRLEEVRKAGEPLYNALCLLRETSYLYKLTAGRSKACDSKDEERRVTRAKRMISNVGARSLRSVAHRVLRRASSSVSEDAAQEVVSRAFFAILNKILPSKPVHRIQ